MSKFPIDLSKFRKIQSEDKDITILQHKDGHKVHLAHKALSPKMRGQLAELRVHMADGGEVAIKKENYKENKVNKQLYADGGEVEQDQKPPVIVNVGTQPQVPVPQQMPLPGPDPQMGATGVTGVTGPNPEQSAQANNMALSAPLGPASESPQNVAPTPEAMAALQQDNQQDRGLAASQQKPVDQSQQDPYGAGLSSSLYMEGLDERKKGILGEAVAQAEANKVQAAAIRNSRIAQENVLKDYKNNLSQLEEDRQNFMHDYEQKHIDPNRVFNNMSTGNKISTAIGLILGGFGAAAGQENAGLAMLKMQIQNDIDAQKADMDKGKNLLAFNMQHFKNINEATEMTRLQLNDIAAKRLQEGIATMQSPILKAKALQQLGQLRQESSQMAGQMAARKAMLSAPNGVISAEKKIEFGLSGDAQKEARKQLEEAQAVIKGRDNVLAAYDEIAKLNTLGNKLTSNIQTNRRIAALKAVIPGLSKDTAGRYTEQDAKALEALFSKPLNSEKTVAANRQALLGILNSRIHFPTLKAYNINPLDDGRYDEHGRQRVQTFEPNLK